MVFLSFLSSKGSSWISSHYSQIVFEVAKELTQCLSPSSNIQNLHCVITFPFTLADILVQLVWENSTSFNPSVSPLPIALTYASFRLQYLQSKYTFDFQQWPIFSSKNHVTLQRMTSLTNKNTLSDLILPH